MCFSMVEMECIVYDRAMALSIPKNVTSHIISSNHNRLLVATYPHCPVSTQCCTKADAEGDAAPINQLSSGTYTHQKRG